MKTAIHPNINSAPLQCISLVIFLHSDIIIALWRVWGATGELTGPLALESERTHICGRVDLHPIAASTTAHSGYSQHYLVWKGYRLGHQNPALLLQLFRQLFLNPLCLLHSQQLGQPTPAVHIVSQQLELCRLKLESICVKFLISSFSERLGKCSRVANKLVKFDRSKCNLLPAPGSQRTQVEARVRVVQSNFISNIEETHPARDIVQTRTMCLIRGTGTR